ncbi:hypothetical protein COT07_01875 [Candidatus Woesearchaeota archaeon CG07_land_8_20_14_0_80_44_23]|nr:MAG: hypothetical protein COT07_01875 [Candidatus Woesearchaeota archaeon CG07_land_8_20_14_0_80_44_23]
MKKKQNTLYVYRKRKIRVFRVIIAVLVLAVIAAAIFYSRTAGYASIAVAGAKSLWLKITCYSPVIASVNGKPITQAEFDRRFSVFLFVKGIPESYKNSMDRKTILGQVITEDALLQEARKEGISVTQEQARATLDEAINQSALTEELLKTMMKSRGLSEKDLQDYYRRNLIIIALLNKTVESKMNVTEQDMRNFYNETMDRYTAKPGEIRLRQIVVNSSKDAESIMQALNNSSDFVQEAYYNSLDRESAVYGGDLGFINNQSLPTKLSQAAFALRQGQTSSPVYYNSSYYIFRRENNTISYDEIKQEIRNGLESSIRNTLMLDYLLKIRNAAKIEYFGWASQNQSANSTA